MNRFNKIIQKHNDLYQMGGGKKIHYQDIAPFY